MMKKNRLNTISVGWLFCSLLLFFSCAKDQTDPQVQPRQLILSASATEIMEGETVTFIVKADGQPVNANIYVDNSKISGNKYVFDEKGSYTIMAKQEGYENSETVVIKVTEKPKLKIAASDSVVTVGDTVIFEVTSGGTSVEADIFVNNSKIMGNSYVFSASGIFTVMAKEEGYANSDTIEIKVEEAKEVIIYMAGLMRDGPSSASNGMYWKNGTAVPVGEGTEVRLNDIVVEDGTVFVAGSEEYSIGQSKAKYWKNGNEVRLSGGSGSSMVYGMVVNGANIYTAGWASFDGNGRFYNKIPVYWENGQMSALIDSNSYIGEARDIEVENGDVYVTGWYSPGVLQPTIAAYWKNGKLVSLTDGQDYALAFDIAIENGDVYVAGYDEESYGGYGSVAKYWKNGNEVVLSDGTKPAQANAITIVNGDVYVAGSIGGISIYWKNGEAVTIPNIDGKTVSVSDIAVVDGDVYIAGTISSGSYTIRSVCLKNGEPVMTIGEYNDWTLVFGMFVSQE